ncbi:MAG: 50S ribosomal protein L24 [Defluviitaleaceae bacterium]|nr:50S ribosomal protein L24 [Defluviitaleaceae bacterium]
MAGNTKVQEKKPIKSRLKRGDKVKVITGKDKGKTGKVLFIDRLEGRVIVEGVNMITKHQKSNMSNRSGGIIHKEAPIHISNVMYMDGNKPSRIGFQVEVDTDVDGARNVTKHRVAKATGNVID